jgi:hypothetical protein
MVAPLHSAGMSCMPDGMGDRPHQAQHIAFCMPSERVQELAQRARRLPKVCMAAFSTPLEPEV